MRHHLTANAMRVERNQAEVLGPAVDRASDKSPEMTGETATVTGLQSQQRVPRGAPPGFHQLPAALPTPQHIPDGIPQNGGTRRRGGGRGEGRREGRQWRKRYDDWQLRAKDTDYGGQPQSREFAGQRQERRRPKQRRPREHRIVQMEKQPLTTSESRKDSGEGMRTSDRPQSTPYHRQRRSDNGGCWVRDVGYRRREGHHRGSSHQHRPSDKKEHLCPSQDGQNSLQLRDKP